MKEVPALLPHQEAAIRKHEAAGVAFFAYLMEMGTGKTCTTIHDINRAYMRGEINAVLLIAPEGIRDQWMTQQVPEHSEIEQVPFRWENGVSKKYDNDFTRFVSMSVPAGQIKWLYVNIDRFSGDAQKSATARAAMRKLWDYVSGHRTAVIVDEGTVIKNPGSLRTKNVIKIGKAAAARYVLTGSPVTNSPFDLYALFEFLCEGFWGMSFFMFRYRYGMSVSEHHRVSGKRYDRLITASDISRIRWYLHGGKAVQEIAAVCRVSVDTVEYIKKNPDVTIPFKNMDEIRQKIAPYSFIIKKDECMSLPPKQYQTLKVRMVPEQKKVYESMRKTYRAMHCGEIMSVQHKIVLTTRLHQIAGGFFPFKNADGNDDIMQISGGNPKLEILLEEIEEAGELKCIVWAVYVPEINLIHKSLRAAFPGKRVEAYHGEVDPDSREKIITDFQAGDIDVMVINPMVGAMGLNLQAARVHFFYSNSFRFDQRVQAEDRSHRMGQCYSVMYKDIVLEGSVDGMILDALARKKDLADYFAEHPTETTI